VRVIELVLVKSLVTVLVNRQVCNRVGPVRKSVGGEETSEKHERNDEHRGQCHSNLLVRESGGDNHSVTSRGVKDQDQSNKEKHELLKGGVETNGEVSDGTEDHRQADAVGKLREDLGPEIGSDIVHVVVNFSQEDGTLLREDQNDILDSDEKGIHSHEEKRTLNVLPTSSGIQTGLPEQNTDEDTSTHGSEELHVGGLGKTDDVVEVSSGKKSPLEAPRLHSLSGCGINTLGLRVNVTSIIAEIGGVVLVVKVLDTVSVGLQNVEFLLIVSSDLLSVEEDVLTVDFLVFDFSNNGLFRHDTHEIVSWVTIVRARETNAGEILGGVLGVVVVDDLTSSDEEKLIELVEGLSVRLMDG